MKIAWAVPYNQWGLIQKSGKYFWMAKKLLFLKSLGWDFKIIKTFLSYFFPGYYGISMSATGLGGNIFVSFILLAMIEIPSYVFNILVMDHWGRKPIFVSSLLLTGVACISAGFLDDGAGKTVLALIGTGFTI